MHILVVDDEWLVRSYLKQMLEAIHPSYAVVTAEDGEEALQIYKSGKPFDVVVMDIRMPGMDGLKVLNEMTQLKSDQVSIMLTGYAEFEYAVEALQKGAFEYLVKPVTPEKLTEVMRKAERKISERKEERQIHNLRNRSAMEKRIADLLHEQPIPHYDQVLFPTFVHAHLFSVKPDPSPDWNAKLLLFSIKNLLEESLSEYGAVFAIVDKHHVTAIVLSSSDQLSKDGTERINQLVTQVQATLKVALKVGIGGESEQLSEVTELYQASLRQLNLWFEPDEPKPQSGYAYSRLIRKALEIIRTEYAQELSLTDLAERLDTNPNYLSQLFKSNTGKTFTQHLLDARIGEAKRLLSDTTLRIYQICDEIGYADQSYFSRIFKMETGMSPNEYREKTE